MVQVTTVCLHALKLYFWDHTPQTDFKSHCQHCQPFVCHLVRICYIMCKLHHNYIYNQLYLQHSTLLWNGTGLATDFEWDSVSYMPIVCLSIMHGIEVIIYLTIPYECISTPDQVTFHSQPSKQLHTLTLLMQTSQILSAVTNILEAMR